MVQVLVCGCWVVICLAMVLRVVVAGGGVHDAYYTQRIPAIEHQKKPFAYQGYGEHHRAQADFYTCSGQTMLRTKMACILKLRAGKHVMHSFCLL